MNKKTLILAGFGLMVLGAYLYTKAKSVAKSAEDKAGDAVANKVGDVTESILNKVKSGGDATVTNAVNNTLPPRLAPLPAPIRTAKDSVVSPNLAPAGIVQNPRFNETAVWEPIVAPTTIVPQKSTVTISDSFDSNNWQNMVN